jgi:hypothetical protein
MFLRSILASIKSKHLLCDISVTSQRNGLRLYADEEKIRSVNVVSTDRCRTLRTQSSLKIQIGSAVKVYESTQH